MAGCLWVLGQPFRAIQKPVLRKRTRQKAQQDLHAVATLCNALSVAGVTIKCLKCKGTGDMGHLATCRCRYCSGKGRIEIEKLPEVILWEWCEGYIDDDTSDEWLEDTLKKLIAVRKKARAGQLKSRDDEGLIDEDPED